MRLDLALAWRFNVRNKQERSLSFLAGLTVFSCALGVACLIITLALISGYERSLLRVMSRALPHLSVQSNTPALPKPSTIRQILAKRVAIDDVGTYASGRVLVKAAHASKGQIRIVSLQGVRLNANGAQKEAVRLAELVYVNSGQTLPTQRRQRALQTVAKLRRKSTLASPTEPILISRRLGRLLGVKLGEHLQAFRAPDTKEGFRLLPLSRSLQVVGWFETGIPSFDELIAITDINALTKIFTHQPITLSLGVWLQKPLEASVASDHLRQGLHQKNLPFSIGSWLAGNQRLFTVLAFQKSLLWVVLLLIVSLAFFGTSATLFVLAQNKQHDLAILRAMGLPKRMLQRVVFWQGMVLGGIGIVLGIGLGCLGAGLLAYFSDAWIPYGIYPGASGAPVWLDAKEVLGVLLASLLICMFAARPVAKRIAAQAPVEALREQR